MIDLELQRRSLPSEPGIYLFKDINNKIIYIGKASNLRKRVSQYFLKSTYNDPYYEDKIQELVKRINSIEYIVTENEKEALILEHLQIKKHFPRFNVIMKDSKSYPYVAIFYAEDFPRIRVIRGPEKYSQENLFLGPYTDKKEISRILRDLRKIFPYCSCKKKVGKRKRPCLYYQLNLCPGPCIEAISKNDYLDNIQKVEMFLKGDTDNLKKQINQKLENAAKEQNYEVAAFWRDKLDAIESSTSQQHVLIDQQTNKDILGYFSDKGYAAIVIIYIREGRISSKNSFHFNLREKLIQKTKILPSLMEQYYQSIDLNLPDTIIVSKIQKEFNLLKDFLIDKKSGLQIRTPIDENEKALLRIAKKNAKVLVNQQIEMEELKFMDEDQIKLTLQSAKKILNLPKSPKIIEGFDISNIEGQDATGSLVYFLDGKPYKQKYRHFKIRSKSTPDDVAMMREVINRRYSYILKRDGQLPDLILVDGGKGQLNAAISVLEDLSIENIPIIGLAKRLEEIFVPGKKESTILPRDSPLLNLLQKVRDEAHRFAVRLHKKQRQKRIKGSVLDNIKGVGPATRNKLLTHFGSVAGIKKASEQEISQIVGKKLAKTILQSLHK